MINKTDKCLARLMKKKGKKFQLLNQECKRDTAATFTEIKRIMEEYYELYVKTGQPK